jgi:hypothetical protein
MSKELTFHSPFQRVTVVMNGQPLSLNAEVTVTLAKPAKLDGFSARVWSQLSAEPSPPIVSLLVGLRLVRGRAP